MPETSLKISTMITLKTSKTCDEAADWYEDGGDLDELEDLYDDEEDLAD